MGNPEGELEEVTEGDVEVLEVVVVDSVLVEERRGDVVDFLRGVEEIEEVAVGDGVRREDSRAVAEEVRREVVVAIRFCFAQCTVYFSFYLSTLVAPGSACVHHSDSSPSTPIRFLHISIPLSNNRRSVPFRTSTNVTPNFFSTS